MLIFYVHMFCSHHIMKHWRILICEYSSFIHTWHLPGTAKEIQDNIPSMKASLSRWMTLRHRLLWKVLCRDTCSNIVCFCFPKINTKHMRCQGLIEFSTFSLRKSCCCVLDNWDICWCCHPVCHSICLTRLLMKAWRHTKTGLVATLL